VGGTYLFKRLYLFVREKEHAHQQGEQQVEGKAGSLLSKEPNMGLNPATPGS